MAWSLGSLCPSHMTLLPPRGAMRPPQAVRPRVSSFASCVLGRSPGPHGSVGKVCQRKAAPPAARPRHPLCLPEPWLGGE